MSARRKTTNHSIDVAVDQIAEDDDVIIIESITTTPKQQQPPPSSDTDTHAKPVANQRNTSNRPKMSELIGDINKLNKTKRRKRKTQNIFHTEPTTRKYRKRIKKNYKDPALVVNSFKRMEAIRHHKKYEPLALPQELQKKKKKKPSAQQRHDDKMNINDREIDNMVRSVNLKQMNNKKTPAEIYKDAINKTAYLYPKKLSPKDPTCFVAKYGADIGIKIDLFPKFRCIPQAKHGQSITKDLSNCWQKISSYFVQGEHEEDCFEHIHDDYNLMKLWRRKKIICDEKAYKHKSDHIRTNTLALKEFKSDIRICSGGPDALNFDNYRTVDIAERYNGRLPGRTCIACNLTLQAIPLYHIGTGTVFALHNKKEKRYKVQLYLVTFLCCNFPICTFPISRWNFDKNWIKVAWYNDINGKEYQQQKQKKLDADRARKEMMKRMRERAHQRIEEKQEIETEITRKIANNVNNTKRKRDTNTNDIIIDLQTEDDEDIQVLPARKKQKVMSDINTSSSPQRVFTHQPNHGEEEEDDDEDDDIKSDRSDISSLFRSDAPSPQSPFVMQQIKENHPMTHITPPVLNLSHCGSLSSIPSVSTLSMGTNSENDADDDNDTIMTAQQRNDSASNGDLESVATVSATPSISGLPPLNPYCFPNIPQLPTDLTLSTSLNTASTASMSATSSASTPATSNFGDGSFNLSLPSLNF